MYDCLCTLFLSLNLCCLSLRPFVCLLCGWIPDVVIPPSVFAPPRLLPSQLKKGNTKSCKL